MKRVFVLITGIILFGVCLLILANGVQFHNWLGLFPNRTNYVRQLDINGYFAHNSFSSDLTMFSGHVTNGMEVWQLNDGKPLRLIPSHIGVFSPDSSLFVAASPEAITIWHTQDWTLSHVSKMKKKMITAIAVSPRLNSLAVQFRRPGRQEFQLQLWQINDGTVLHELEGHTDYITSITYSPDGTILASGGKDYTVRLWQVEDGSLLHTLENDSSVVEKVVFAPNGKSLASATWDGRIHVWETNNGRLLHTLNAHHEHVWDIAYTPNGRMLASAGTYGLVKLWDINNGALQQSFRHNWMTTPIQALAFSPDGKILATAQKYGPVRLFDVGQEMEQ